VDVINSSHTHTGWERFLLPAEMISSSSDWLSLRRRRRRFCASAFFPLSFPRSLSSPPMGFGSPRLRNPSFDPFLTEDGGEVVAVAVEEELPRVLLPVDDVAKLSRVPATVVKREKPDFRRWKKIFFQARKRWRIDLGFEHLASRPNRVFGSLVKQPSRT
jgi:hypothetical protein